MVAKKKKKKKKKKGIWEACFPGNFGICREIVAFIVHKKTYKIVGKFTCYPGRKHCPALLLKFRCQRVL